ncbi:hypothetical protein BKA80DRAFT_117926 [Phyllosticta citrichinensis]
MCICQWRTTTWYLAQARAAGVVDASGAGDGAATGTSWIYAFSQQHGASVRWKGKETIRTVGRSTLLHVREWRTQRFSARTGPISSTFARFRRGGWPRWPDKCHAPRSFTSWPREWSEWLLFVRLCVTSGRWPMWLLSLAVASRSRCSWAGVCFEWSLCCRLSSPIVSTIACHVFGYSFVGLRGRSAFFVMFLNASSSSFRSCLVRWWCGSRFRLFDSLLAFSQGRTCPEWA